MMVYVYVLMSTMLTLMLTICSFSSTILTMAKVSPSLQPLYQAWNVLYTFILHSIGCWCVNRGYCLHEFSGAQGNYGPIQRPPKVNFLCVTKVMSWSGWEKMVWTHDCEIKWQVKIYHAWRPQVRVSHTSAQSKILLQYKANHFQSMTPE